MTVDVCQFGLLLLPVLFGFAAAFKLMYANEATRSASSFDATCISTMSAFDSWISTLQTLFEGAIMGETNIAECIAASTHPFAGRALTYLYMLVMILMLLNMIIAQMSKTFDGFWDEAKEQSATKFARVVLVWEQQKGAPPPLNLLSWPTTMLYWAYHLLAKCCMRCFRKVPLPPEALTTELASGYSKSHPDPDASDAKLVARMEEHTLIDRVLAILLEQRQRAKNVEEFEAMCEECKKGGKSLADAKRKAWREEWPKKATGRDRFVIDTYYGSLQEMNDLRELVADRLLQRFGQWDSTNDLVKHAISVLTAQMRDSRQAQNHEMAKLMRAVGS